MSIKIIVLLIVLLMAIGFLALFVGAGVLLFKNPKTRPWGIALLIVPLGLALLLVLGIYWDAGRPEIVPGESRPATADWGEIHLENGTVVSPDGRNIARTESNSQSEPRAPVVDPTKTANDPQEPRTEPRSLEKGAPGKSLGPFNGWHDSDNGKRDNGNKRPDWIDAPAGMVDNAYQCCVTVGPYTTSLECARSMPNALRPVVADYVKLLLGSKVASPRVIEKVIQANIMGLATKDIWEEKKETSIGPMTQQYVLLVFDRKINDLIRQKLHETYVEQRIIWSGVALGAILVLLVIAFVLLKTDVTTEGKYRRYVLSGVGAVGLGVLYAAILAAAPSYQQGDIAAPVSIIGGGAGIGLTISKKYRYLGVALLTAIFLGSLVLLD